MKLPVSLALIAVLPLQLMSTGLSSADYQAGIREATERYRGDCVEGVFAEGVYFYGSLTRDICEKYLAVFSEFPFTRAFVDSVTSNQALQLTAGRLENYKVEIRSRKEMRKLALASGS